MNKQQKNRLRHLAQPHENKVGWQQEMDALVVDVLAEVDGLEHSLADVMEQLAAIQGTNQAHVDRVAVLVSKCNRLIADNRAMREGIFEQSGEGES